jgi:hypothetical protein
MNELKQQLLDLAYEKAEEFFSAREFECLIALIDDGTINSFEELAKYGVER